MSCGVDRKHILDPVLLLLLLPAGAAPIQFLVQEPAYAGGAVLKKRKRKRKERKKGIELFILMFSVGKISIFFLLVPQFFLFFFGHVCGMQVPRLGIEPMPQQ